jgi:hypothetical protein
MMSPIKQYLLLTAAFALAWFILNKVGWAFLWTLFYLAK